MKKNMETVVKKCAAKLDGNSQTIVERVLNSDDEPAVTLSKLALEVEQPEREVRVRWLTALVELRIRFGSKPEIRNWYDRMLATDENCTAFELGRLVGYAVSELPAGHREVLEICLDQRRRGERVNVTHTAAELGISFQACYERLGRAMVSLKNWLKSHPAVMAQIAEILSIDGEELDEKQPNTFVTRFVRSADFDKE